VEARATALGAFYSKWEKEPLVLLKWLALQAGRLSACPLRLSLLVLASLALSACVAGASGLMVGSTEAGRGMRAGAGLDQRQ
jgi:hypothetical protein